MNFQKQEIFNQIIRKDYITGIYQFESIIEEILLNIGFDKVDIDSLITSEIYSLWNYVIKKHDELIKKKTKPFFIIKDEYSRKISLFPEREDLNKNCSNYLIKSRPNILREIDLMNSRQYEALSCIVCKILGADKVILTRSGNEGGIDFIATIPFSTKSHYFFGINGPIRIVGQSKKFNTKKLQDNSVKEFVTTLNDIYNLNPKIINIIPNWFRSAKGIIIGWFINHSGFQSGAISRSNNYGFILSDSIDLAEIISSSRKFFPLQPSHERANSLQCLINNILKIDTNIDIDFSNLKFCF